MKLYDQVITREQAQRLKELGVDGDSLFAWEQSGLPGECRVAYPSEFARQTKREFPNQVKWIQAWTVAELGQMLPDYTRELGNLEIGKSETDHISMKPKKEKWWNVSYWTLSGRVERDLYIPEQKSKHLQQAATLAQTLAKMLIYLLENNLLSVSEVNERLKG